LGYDKSSFYLITKDNSNLTKLNKELKFIDDIEFVEYNKALENLE